MSYAKGEYLSFLDADDIFEKDMLEVAYNKAVEDKRQIWWYLILTSITRKRKEYKKADWTLRYAKIPPYTPFKHRQMTDNVFKVFVGWAWGQAVPKGICGQICLKISGAENQ